MNTKPNRIDVATNVPTLLNRQRDSSNLNRYLCNKGRLSATQKIILMPKNSIFEKPASFDYTGLKFSRL